MRSLERRYNLVQDAIRQRNGVANEAAVEPEDPKRCGDGGWLLAAQPGERAGCERYIVRLLEQQSRLYQREAAKLRDPTTTSPRYRELRDRASPSTQHPSPQPLTNF